MEAPAARKARWAEGAGSPGTDGDGGSLGAGAIEEDGQCFGVNGRHGGAYQSDRGAVDEMRKRIRGHEGQRQGGKGLAGQYGRKQRRIRG